MLLGEGVAARSTTSWCAASTSRFWSSQAGDRASSEVSNGHGPAIQDPGFAEWGGVVPHIDRLPRSQPGQNIANGTEDSRTFSAE
jgi:hypothetical protein